MEKQKNISLVADVIAPVAVIAVTVVLFLLFMPAEPGSLFWTNLVYLVFLEVTLFAYIVWLPNRNSSVVLKWMSGVFTLFYIGAGLAWMILFSAALCHWAPMKVYYAGIMVLTVLWIFVGALTVKVDHSSNVATAALSDNRRRADYVRAQADMLLGQFRLTKAREAESAVTALCRGLSTISPAAMSDPAAANRITSICEGLEALLAQPAGEDLTAQLKEYAEKSLITLNSLKKSILK